MVQVHFLQFAGQAGGRGAARAALEVADPAALATGVARLLDHASTHVATRAVTHVATCAATRGATRAATCGATRAATHAATRVVVSGDDLAGR